MDYYAAFYDANAGPLYKKLGRFLKHNVRFSGRRVLCLASGSGFFPELYLDNGAQHVTSVDVSPDFLRLAQDRLKDHSARKNIVFVRADMAQYETRNLYDLVFINGNSFCYLQTQEEQLHCLRRIKKHLKTSGRAYIHIIPLSRGMNADFTLKRTGRMKSGVKIEERGAVDVDYDQHRLDFNISWKIQGRKYKTKVRTRIMTVPEFSLLVKVAGLKICRVWGDYRRRIPAHPYSRIYELKK